MSICENAAKVRFALRYSLAPEWEAVVELSTCKCKVTYWRIVEVPDVPIFRGGDIPKALGMERQEYML